MAWEASFLIKRYFFRTMPEENVNKGEIAEPWRLCDFARCIGMRLDLRRKPQAFVADFRAVKASVEALGLVVGGDERNERVYAPGAKLGAQRVHQALGNAAI